MGHSDSMSLEAETSLENFSTTKPSHSEKSEQESLDSPIKDAPLTPNLSPPKPTEPESIAGGYTPESVQRSHSSTHGHGLADLKEDEEAVRKDEDEEDEQKRYEVQWEGDHDPMNPRCMSHGRKWIIVLIVSAGSTCVTCASSMYTLTYAQITSEFRVSRVVATLGLSLFVVGLGIGPMVLGPLSEFYGRRPIYVVSFTFFLVWLIPCAVAKNIGTELIARFIDGLAGSAFLSVAGGTVGDMFARNELQAPMMIFTASPFIGPPVGPMIAGFINQYTSWCVVLRCPSCAGMLTFQAMDVLCLDHMGCRDARPHSCIGA